MRLQIADNFSLPLDFVTQTQAILAKRGVGKSYTASVEAEELLKADQQVVIIDPTGAWFGLKSSADGKHAGFPIAIFGGEQADAPLEETAGEVIASAIVERRFSAILDLSLFRKSQINRFMGPFLETLYRLNREAMHLIVDEADAIAPQRPFGEEARMLGAMEDVVRRGRRRGIGCTLITQRPQVLNKNVLTQCEILCVLRLVHPKDIDAIQEWVAVHGDTDRAKQMIASLPSLPVGTAWFWAPGWGDIFRTVQIRQRETFDSSATPKPGEARRAPTVIAPVDLVKLGEQIQATVQRAKDNDPSVLKRRIAELERKPANADPKTVERAVEAALRQRDSEHKKQLSGYLAMIERMQAALVGIGKQAAQFVNIELPKEQRAPVVVDLPAPRVVAHSAAPRRIPNVSSDGDKLPRAERLILTALAQYEQGRSKVQLATLTGYAHTGGGFNNSLGALRRKEYVQDYGDLLRITPAGLEALGDFTPLPTGDALLQHWCNQLGRAERAILEALAGVWPNTMTKDDVAATTGYEVSGGGFNNALGRLRTLELISGRNELKVSHDLFG